MWCDVWRYRDRALVRGYYQVVISSGHVRGFLNSCADNGLCVLTTDSIPVGHATQSISIREMKKTPLNYVLCFLRLSRRRYIRLTIRYMRGFRFESYIRYSAVQSQKAVTAYFSSKQLLPSDIADRHCVESLLQVCRSREAAPNVDLCSYLFTKTV